MAHGFESRENEHNWNDFDKGRPRGHGNDAMVNNNENLNVLNEKN